MGEEASGSGGEASGSQQIDSNGVGGSTSGHGVGGSTRGIGVAVSVMCSKVKAERNGDGTTDGDSDDTSKRDKSVRVFF